MEGSKRTVDHKSLQCFNPIFPPKGFYGHCYNFPALPRTRSRYNLNSTRITDTNYLVCRCHQQALYIDCVPPLCQRRQLYLKPYHVFITDDCQFLLTTMALIEWQAVQWDCGCGDGLFITILFHGKGFRVSLLPPSSNNSIEGPLIRKFDSMNDDDQDEVFAVQNEIDAIIYEAGGPMWAQLAPSIRLDAQPSDLHSLLYPETFSFQLVTGNGRAELLEQETDDSLYHDQHGMKIVNDIGLPKYSSKDIRVLETLVGQGYIAQVLVGGTEMCCKSGDDAFWQSIGREFEWLRKVTKSGRACEI